MDHLIDQYLPSWQFREIHTRRIQAPARQVMSALLALTPRNVPMSGFLLGLRLAPAAVAARRWPLSPDRPWIELLTELGFVELGRTSYEVALGAIGKFWRIREELAPLADADAFVRFDEPGFAKGAMNFRLDRQVDSVTLSTETLVWATDAGARRRFQPYWIPVRILGGLMRQELLLSVARHALRSSAPA
jgi:hypothetical protein